MEEEVEEVDEATREAVVVEVEIEVGMTEVIENLAKKDIRIVFNECRTLVKAGVYFLNNT